MEEVQNSEELEFTTPEHDATIVEQEAQVEAAESQEDTQENQQDRNWREMRKKEQENQQKIKIQEEIIQKLVLSQQNQQQQAPQAPPEVDEIDGIADDEFLSKGQSRRVFQKDARAVAREEFMRLEKERNDANFVGRLKNLYPDFDDVVNSETIAIFEQSKPKLAETIAASKDPYQMGLQTYEYIKALNLTSQADDNRHAKEVNKKIDKNEKIVQSPQAYSKRPMAQAFSLANMSGDEKMKLYEEMMGCASQGGGGY